jgi:hypothetical protein
MVTAEDAFCMSLPRCESFPGGASLPVSDLRRSKGPGGILGRVR